MSTVIIERRSDLANFFRKVAIIVDDNQVGFVKNGEGFEFSITPGKHIIYAKIDWCTSPIIPITIPENTEVTFDLYSVPLSMAFYTALFDSKNYLRLLQRNEISAI